MKRRLMCLGIILSKYPLRIVLYDVQCKKLRIKHTLEDISKYAADGIVNFRKDDECYFSEKDIPTISMRALLSIAFDCSLTLEQVETIFKRTIHMRYSSYFIEGTVDFSATLLSPLFWEKIAVMTRQCFKMIGERGLSNFLELEKETIPILHRIFDTGYPVDVQKAVKEYRKLEKVLTETKDKLWEKYCIYPYMHSNYKGNDEISRLTNLYEKTEKKMRQFPVEVTTSREKILYLSCEFNSIGTDSFRITTYKYNVQGFSKDLRSCFLPKFKGNVLVEYDVVSSQIMLLGYLSGEQKLINLYQKGEDIYSCIASYITGKSFVGTVERNTYKHMVLQLTYGAGSRTIFKEIGSESKISYETVLHFKNGFYNLFPAIKEYSDMVKTTDEIHLPDGRIWEMQGVIEPYKRLAYIMQYLESLLLRKAMELIYDRTKGMKIWLYLCIHDSVWVETTHESVQTAKRIVQQSFNDALKSIFKNSQFVRLDEEAHYGKEKL